MLPLPSAILNKSYKWKWKYNFLSAVLVRAGQSRNASPPANWIALQLWVSSRQRAAQCREAFPSLPLLQGLTEVSQLELPLVVDQQVLRLEVPVQHLPSVTVREPAKQLEQEDLSGRTH